MSATTSSLYEPVEILPARLWISRKPSKDDLAVLKTRLKDRIVIIDLTHDENEKGLCKNLGVIYEQRTPETPDNYQPIAVGSLKTLARIIDDHLSSDRKVIIHCQAGTGRSPTVAAAYLIHTGTPVSEARKHIKEKSPTAWEGRDANYGMKLEDLQAMYEMTRDNPEEPFTG